MKVLYRAARAGVALLFGACLAGAAAAKEPAAMVLETQGAVMPELEAFSELAAGDKVDLGKDGQLSFSHYAKCQNVVVEGGVVQIDAKDYKVTGGKVVDVQQAPCPKNVQLSGAGEIGGVVMRGIKTSEIKLGERPAFKLTGARSADVKALKIVKNQKTLYEGAVKGQSFAWPAGHEPLQVARGYELHLTGGDGKQTVMTFDVVKTPGAKEPIVKVE